MPALSVVPEIQRETLADLERAIDIADEQARNGFIAGVRCRWESGRIMVEARVGKKLPSGMREQFMAETGKSAAELTYRMQLADAYETEQALFNALNNYNSWRELAKSLTRDKPDPDDQPVEDPDDPLGDIDVPELTEGELAERASRRELQRLIDLETRIQELLTDFISASFRDLNEYDRSMAISFLHGIKGSVDNIENILERMFQ